jgi:hypothetical protein
VAVSYASMLDDIFMHFGHNWEFTHDQLGMLKLVEQLGAEKEFESYENITNFLQYDAIWIFANTEKAIGKSIPNEDIGKGYEIQRNTARAS